MKLELKNNIPLLFDMCTTMLAEVGSKKGKAQKETYKQLRVQFILIGNKLTNLKNRSNKGLHLIEQFEKAEASFDTNLDHYKPDLDKKYQKEFDDLSFIGKLINKIIYTHYHIFHELISILEYGDRCIVPDESSYTIMLSKTYWNSKMFEKSIPLFFNEFKQRATHLKESKVAFTAMLELCIALEKKVKEAYNYIDTVLTLNKKPKSALELIKDYKKDLSHMRDIYFKGYADTHKVWKGLNLTTTGSQVTWKNV